MAENIGHRIQSCHQRIDRKAPGFEDLHHAVLRISRHVRHFAPGISEKFQFAACRHFRVELSQRARCGVARIDIGLLALGFHLRVERQEVALGHIDLAAHLDDVRGACRQGLGDFLDGSDIGGDIFAGRAVAARCGAHQAAILVADRHGKAVDLRLGGKGDRVIRKAAEEAIDAGDEILDVFLREGIVERQHRSCVNDRREGFGRCRANSPRWAVGANQSREPGLDGIVAPLQRIVVRIRNLRRVLAVIKRVVARDLSGQIGKRCGRFLFAQIFDGLLFGAHESTLPDFGDVLEHFREKCEAVFHWEHSKNKSKIRNSIADEHGGGAHDNFMPRAIILGVRTWQEDRKRSIRTVAMEIPIQFASRRNFASIARDLR